MFFALGAGFAASTFVAAQPITFGQQKFFKDWAVACDNALTCEAINLPDAIENNDALAVVLRRGYRPGDELSISISGFSTSNDRYRLRVDGKDADTGTLTANQSEIVLTEKEALKVARALARGKAFALIDGDGKRLGNGSLAGSTAALQFVDSIQNRTGTADALASAGRKAARPKWAPLPVVRAQRIGSSAPIPGTAEMIDLIEKSPCSEQRFGVTEDAAYSLGKMSGVPRALVLISCGNGTYNMVHAPYVGTKNAAGKWIFEPARFDFVANKEDPPLLVNASWEPQKQQLDSFSKGRGLGDCGNAESYVWDGTMFRLISAIGLSECRGSTNWLTLWRAEVELFDR